MSLSINRDHQKEQMEHWSPRREDPQRNERKATCQSRHQNKEVFGTSGEEQECTGWLHPEMEETNQRCPDPGSSAIIRANPPLSKIKIRLSLHHMDKAFSIERLVKFICGFINI